MAEMKSRPQGWTAGLGILQDKLSELSWLTTVIVFMGIGISLMLLVRVALAPWLELKSPLKKQS